VITGRDRPCAYISDAGSVKEQSQPKPDIDLEALQFAGIDGGSIDV